jgi:hypothetical protein
MGYVPENLVHAVRGGDALLDCTRYLTHESVKEQLAGKYRYPDTEIHVSDNFIDWRERLDAQEDNAAKYGKGKSRVDKIILDILEHGKTIKQCYRDMDGNEYMNNLSKLYKARGEYLEKKAPLPRVRVNYYIHGPGGIGKDILSDLVARALYPDIETLEEIAFNAGDPSVSFDGYDGQPVIIWSDMRAESFINRFTREGTFRIRNTHPKNEGCFSVKHGKTRLLNEVNIINGIQPYEEFVLGLAGEYTDKFGKLIKSEDAVQSFRRLPIVAEISEEFLKVLVNKGFFNDTREYQQYVEYANVRMNFGFAIKKCRGTTSMLEEHSEKAVKFLKEAGDEAKEKAEEQLEDLDSLPPVEVVYLSPMAAARMGVEPFGSPSSVDEQNNFFEGKFTEVSS